MDFSNNRTISIRQVRRTLTLEMLGISTLQLPRMLAENTGMAGIFILVAAAFFALLLLILWKHCFENRHFYDTLHHCPKGIQVIVSFFYAAAFLGLGGYVLYLLCQIIREYLLQTAFEPWILLTLTVAAVYGLRKGIEPRVRIYEVLYVFLLIPLIVILCLALKSVQPDYWWTIGESVPSNAAKSMYITFLYFALSSLILLFWPYCSRKKEAIKGAKISLLTVLIWNVAIYLILTGVFRTGLLSRMPYPVLTLMAVVKLPCGFLHRQDAFMVGIWFFCLFCLFNAMLFYGSEMLTSAIRAITEKRCERASKEKAQTVGFALGWGCGAVCLLVSVLLLYTGISAENFRKVYLWGIAPVMLLLPLFIWLLQKRKGEKERK